MEDISIFTIKEHKPTETELPGKLGSSYLFWKELNNFVMGEYPGGTGEWNFPGKKYGWSYRIKDRKRAILYFLPRNGFFKVAFVFGQKATDKIQKSDISEIIKEDLVKARKYAEGRGIRIDVKDDTVIGDIKKLVRIKMEN